MVKCRRQGPGSAKRKLSEFDDSPVDTLIVPGSPSIRQIVAQSAALAELAARCFVTATRTASVCSGTFFAAARPVCSMAGVPATHWVMAELVQARYPQVELDQGRSSCSSSRCGPAAGVRPGSIWLWHWSRLTAVAKSAMQVARHMVVYYRRPDNQEQWGSLLQSQFPPVPDRQALRTGELPRLIACSSHCDGWFLE